MSSGAYNRAKIPGFNGLVVCDCGSTAFRVGVKAQDGHNHIRVLECCVCHEQMPIPWQGESVATVPPDGVTP